MTLSKKIKKNKNCCYECGNSLHIASGVVISITITENRWQIPFEPKIHLPYELDILLLHI